MAWVLVITAGLLEFAWSVGMKYTHGFTRLWPSLFTGAGIVASMLLLARAARSLPIGTAYGVVGRHRGGGRRRGRDAAAR